MKRVGSEERLDRRQVLLTSGVVAGGVLATGGAALARGPDDGMPDGRDGGRQGPPAKATPLPVTQLEQILMVPGNVSSTGAVSFQFNRNDLTVYRNGVLFLPSFEINGMIAFQGLGDDKAIFNGNVALLDREIDPFIDGLLHNGFVFQAFHQHFYDLNPQTWHIHFRGVGVATQLADGISAILRNRTTTPLPQYRPAQTSPLDANALAKILGGSATYGDYGVVKVTVPRADRIVLGGIPIVGDLGVSLNVFFQPTGRGDTAVVSPDFPLTAQEVQPVIMTMRRQGWDINCLYNQETDEFPQLYFSHQLKIGSANQLAREIRNGANLVNLMFSS